MSEELYNVYVDNHLISQRMPLEYVLIFIKAIYTEFYLVERIKVTIEKVSDGEMCKME